jgi:hypothetical protein
MGCRVTDILYFYFFGVWNLRRNLPLRRPLERKGFWEASAYWSLQHGYTLEFVSLPEETGGLLIGNTQMDLWHISKLIGVLGAEEYGDSL